MVYFGGDHFIMRDPWMGTSPAFKVILSLPIACRCDVWVFMDLFFGIRRLSTLLTSLDSSFFTCFILSVFSSSLLFFVS